MKKIISVFVFVFLFLIGISFSIKNTQLVDLSYYFGLQWQGPLTILLLFTMLLGIVIGLLVGSVWWLRSRRQAGKAKRRINALDKELTGLRSLSVKDEV